MASFEIKWKTHLLLTLAVIVSFSKAGIFSLFLGEALIATRPVPVFGIGFLLVLMEAFLRRDPFSTGSPTDGWDLERGRGERLLLGKI